MTNPFTAFAFNPSNAITILPLGDSITFGYPTAATQGSYRQPLYNDLLSANDVTCAFTGSNVSGNNATTLNPAGTFPSPANDGFTGEVVNGIWGEFVAWVASPQYVPSALIIVIAGTNDMLAHTAPSTVLTTYASMLSSISTTLATFTPNAKCICCSIPPIDPAFDATAAALVPTFNAGLPSVIASAGANFSFLDLNASLTLGDLIDGVHPNATGNSIIASVMQPAILALIAGGLPSKLLSPPTITLPTRLAEIKNVKDFGATGAGFPTDDWAAIMAAFNWTGGGGRGTIYFPPGNYYVSQPIDFSGANIGAFFRGEFGASTVTGNFPDYVFKRALGDTAGDSSGHIVENLTIINTHANGGGVRMGAAVGAAVRNCVITANQGINTASNDTQAGVATQEGNIENCTLSPGSNVTGSNGILSVSDGPILNCTVTGYETGARFWGQAGSQNVLGCRFETCGVGIAPGQPPQFAISSGTYVSGTGVITLTMAITVNFSVGATASLGNLTGTGAWFDLVGTFPILTVSGATVTLQGTSGFGAATITGGIVECSNTSNSSLTVSGTAFKNCGTAVQNLGGFTHMSGVQITGTNGAAPGGTNPQYGISIAAGGGSGKVEGVVVSGQYDVAGIAIAGGEATPSLLTFIGVQVTNSGSGVTTWSLPATAMTAQFVGCNVSVKYTMAKLPARTFAIDTITGNGTTVTIISSALANWLPVASPGANISVSGVSPGGFNGIFNGANVIDFETVTYSNSTSGSGSGGSMTFTATPEVLGVPNASEGDTYNVTDANTSTWGSFPVGAGSTHALVRMNSTLNWSVVGI